ncbi:MAG: LAGLIDADG family homing endonuclease, partial [Acidiferrobacterales bacterium]
LIDRINDMNNNWFCENIRATNPCITGDTWIHTAEGPYQVRDLVGRSFRARVNGADYVSGPDGFFHTGTKPVVRLRTAEGYGLRLTSDHRVRRVTRFTRYSIETEWCPTGELRPGDRVLLNDHRSSAVWPGQFTREEGYLLGLLVGDGTLKADKAVLSVWTPAIAANSGNRELPVGVHGVMEEALQAAKTLPHRADFLGWQSLPSRSEHRLSLGALRSLAARVGMRPGHKAITPAIERGSSEFYRGFLRGLFDADGSVQGTQSKGISVRLAQSDLLRLEAVQRMLLRLGIVSVIYKNRRRAGLTRLPDGRGGHTEYAIRPQHELVISEENLPRFRDLIDFAESTKAARLRQALGAYRRSLNRERFTARVIGITADGVEDVYDAQVPGVNAFDADGLHAHNCGEQPLPQYGSCLLGSVNLTKFVEHPFTDEARFNWERYREVVSIFTRMLDNVVEINGLPLQQQRHEIAYKRRHGMGFLGLGSTLTMLRMKYGEPDSLAFTERVTREMAEVGWQTGIELAEEKGPAPIMVDEFTVTEEMLARRPEMRDDGFKAGDTVPGKVLLARYSHYMQQLDPGLTACIAETGARFTHHTSIAPAGTISLSLGNNASNGIEPSFAHQYSRNVIREGRKTKEKVEVFSYELLAYRALVNPEATPYSDDGENSLPGYFVTADDITPREHVDIQAAAQKWVDSSISKTANVPTDFPFEEFKNVYLYAYERGLKGCTTFRFNPEAFQGVLVKDKDLENTTYRFQLDDGEVIEAKGNEEVEYDGETHTAANLFDALKEGYYGKF